MSQFGEKSVKCELGGDDIKQNVIKGRETEHSIIMKNVLSLSLYFRSDTTMITVQIQCCCAAAATKCTLSFIYVYCIHIPIEPHQPEERKQENWKKNMEEWRIQTWLSFDSAHSHFLHLFVASMFLVSCDDYLLANTFWSITLCNQRYIQSGHTQSSEHDECRWYIALSQLPVACRFPIFFSFRIRYAFDSIREKNGLCVCVCRSPLFRWLQLFCYRWYIGTRYLPFNVFVWWCAYK